MYAHLKKLDNTPVISSGYSLRCKIKFEYGEIKIDAECTVYESGTNGTFSLTMYRDDKPARLLGGEFPESYISDETENAEIVFLRKTMPRSDIVYILSLFGMKRPANEYENRRYVRVETANARKHKFYDRIELDFSEDVNELWLGTYGISFGYVKTKKL